MSPTTPTRLRIEHGPRALGIGARRPRLSWWLPSGAQRQEAYEVEAVVDGKVWSTAPVEDESPILRLWPFPALDSRSAVSWRVRVRTDTGWSEWSVSHEFETGLLDTADWQAHFVGVEITNPLPPCGERGALYFRKRFEVRERPDRARVYATAHGIYELHVDGVRVGDLELTPGFTSYPSHLEVQTYDVTDLVGPGEHELVATVTDGWWRGATGSQQRDRFYGDALELLAQLEITGSTGETTIVATDGTWEVSGGGPIIAADLMRGQQIDHSIPFPPTEDWKSARVSCGPDERLTISPAPPTRRVQDYRPVSVTRLDDHRQVVDLGANINGWVRLSADALNDGGRVRLRHGEHLGADGDVDTGHLGAPAYDGKSLIDVGMVDVVIGTKPDAPEFEPRHTTHGFQFVGVDGARDLTPEDLTGVMVHTDMARTGWFRCSDERVNALHEAAVLSFRGNACEVPTDCPTRERAGWTGDWQLFAPTAAFLYDIAGFSARWLRDLAAEQREDGMVTNVVPDPETREPGTAGHFMQGSAGWGDAAVHVPYQIWRSYGDTAILSRQYESMKSWVEFALDRAASGRHHSREATRPDPAPHERYLWDSGFHFGEWLEPGVDIVRQLQENVDQGHVATAYLHRSLSTLAEIAGLVGRRSDAEHYRTLAERTRSAWHAEYVSADGEVTPATQANLTRALAFGLVDDLHRERIANDLVKLVRAAGTHLATGFLTTPFLLPVLADNGHLDVAYELLLQDSPPSWLYMMDQGATTIWENWEGLEAATLGTAGLGSLNHYSKGAVISFLHEHVAGIQPIEGVPAYRRFAIRPQPGGGITSAEARLDTPYGAIRSSWQIDGGTFTLETQVAPGTQAEISLPDGSILSKGPGTHQFTVPLD